MAKKTWLSDIQTKVLRLWCLKSLLPVGFGTDLKFIYDVEIQLNISHNSLR